MLLYFTIGFIIAFAFTIYSSPRKDKSHDRLDTPDYRAPVTSMKRRVHYPIRHYYLHSHKDRD